MLTGKATSNEEDAITGDGKSRKSELKVDEPKQVDTEENRGTEESLEREGTSKAKEI